MKKEERIYLPDELKEEWVKKLEFYDELIEENGWKIRPTRFVVRHILQAEYAYWLYPGSSHDMLLISKPISGRIDFTQTLSIHYNQMKQVLEFSYKDGPHLEWSEDCQASEGVDTFEYFMEWKKDWKQ
jgi:hypothetical protein